MAEGFLALARDAEFDFFVLLRAGFLLCVLCFFIAIPADEYITSKERQTGGV